MDEPQVTKKPKSNPKIGGGATSTLPTKLDQEKDGSESEDVGDLSSGSDDEDVEATQNDEPKTTKKRVRIHECKYI